MPNKYVSTTILNIYIDPSAQYFAILYEDFTTMSYDIVAKSEDFAVLLSDNVALYKYNNDIVHGFVPTLPYGVHCSYTLPQCTMTLRQSHITKPQSPHTLKPCVRTLSKSTLRSGQCTYTSGRCYS